MGGTRTEHGEAIDRYNFPFRPGEFGGRWAGEAPSVWGEALGQGCGIRPGRPGFLAWRSPCTRAWQIQFPARPPRAGSVTLSGSCWFFRPTSQVRSTRLGTFREGCEPFFAQLLWAGGDSFLAALVGGSGAEFRGPEALAAGLIAWRWWLLPSGDGG